MRTGLAAGKDRAVGRFDRNDPEIGLARLQHLADTGNRAAGADPGDKHVDVAGSVIPDFFGGRPPVNFGVGRILELLRDDRIRNFGHELVGTCDRFAHALGAFGQHQLRAKQLEHLAPLDRHGVGHDQNQPIAAGRGNESERDAGIARRRLDQRGNARADLAGGFERLDHRDTDAILDAGDRVEEL